MEGHDQPSFLKFSFSKDERLKNTKTIKELFDKGSSFFIYPFKVFYISIQDPDCAKNKIFISVSKKLYKKAVDRNLIKRRIREAYRLNKSHIQPAQLENDSLIFGVIYVGKQIMTFKDIECKLKMILLRLNEVRSK